jgi:REP element-mobilizing transposase RayT
MNKEGTQTNEVDVLASLADSLCIQDKVLKYSVQLPSDVDPVEVGDEFVVQWSKSGVAAHAPRTLIFFEGPPAKFFQKVAGGWTFKAGFSGFKHTKKNGEKSYSRALLNGQQHLDPLNLDSFMLADSLPEHRWVKGMDKHGEVSQEQAKRYIKWVQKLVEKLQPKVVIFCGKLSHVFGIWSLAPDLKESLPSVDKNDTHKLNTLRLWFTPSRFGSIPNHTVREEGYRLSFVLHPSHEPEQFSQEVHTALGGKEKEPAQLKGDEEEDTQPKKAEEETKEESEQEKEED